MDVVLAAEQIAKALVQRKAKVTAFVSHYAMSGGSLIALAADEIVMDPNRGPGSRRSANRRLAGRLDRQAPRAQEPRRHQRRDAHPRGLAAKARMT